MLKPCPTAFGLPLLIATALSHAQAEEPSCQRLVEFRDGSILRVDLPAKYQFQFRELAEKNVDLVNTTVPLSLGEIQSVRFSKLPVFKQLKKIKSAIGSLGSDDFRVRDRAMRDLVVGSRGFRPFLQDVFGEIKDPETRWRLARTLAALPQQSGIYEHAYDEIQSDSGAFMGDIDDWDLSVDYRGSKLNLNRQSVRSIRVPPETVLSSGSSPIIATTEPILKDLDVLFPEDCVRIDFDTDSLGDQLRPGQDVSRRFIPDGVLIDTSIEGAIFSVNDFSVSGRSGGQSGATHDPLYHGTITLTFCVPGNELDMAGVTHVGLYLAVVLEGGTTVAAYDASGHCIASLVTTGPAHEFLGLRSDVPIHQLKIIPNEDIDPDVTIDDIVFSIPQLLDAGGSPDDLSLDFVHGERLVCPTFQLVGDHVLARPAGGFAAEIRMELADLQQIRTPTKGHSKLPADDGRTRFWMMLDDGSTLLGRAAPPEGKHPRTLVEDIRVDSLPLTAIWSENGNLIPLPQDEELPDQGVAIIAEKKPEFYSRPLLTPDQFTATDADDATVEYSYNRLPSVWLKRIDRQAQKAATGFIRLNTGERIVLGEASTFSLDSFDQHSVSLMRETKQVSISLDSITTLRLPK